MQSARSAFTKLQNSVSGFFPQKQTMLKTRLENRPELADFNRNLTELRTQQDILQRAGERSGKGSIADEKFKALKDIISLMDKRIKKFNNLPPLNDETRELQESATLTTDLKVIVMKGLCAGHHTFSQPRNNYKENIRKNMQPVVYAATGVVSLALTPLWLAVPATLVGGWTANEKLKQSTLYNPKTTTEILLDQMIQTLNDMEVKITDRLIKSQQVALSVIKT